MYQEIDGIHVWAANGQADEGAVAQMRNVSYVGNVASTALMADHHLGYSQPIGGVVAYRDAVSPSGVGYDIGCGVKAVRTNLTTENLPQIYHGKVADEIARRINFGLGGTTGEISEHHLFDSHVWTDVEWIKYLKPKARTQLGTVGSGNHYVDVLVDTKNRIWVACHFGSRGFGHKVATGFLSLAKFNGWSERSIGETMQDNPTLIEKKNNEFLFDAYIAAMGLAGQYAYAGRDYVIDEVLKILGAKAEFTVHNHHNFAWEEEHGGEDLWVVRKGATPAFPGQQGFVGGSMGDIAAIVEGVASPESELGMYSTVHGAGRIMSRGQAKGNRKGTRKGLITRDMMAKATQFVTVRGGDVDESPHVYRPLGTVLDAHAGTTKVIQTMQPIIVVMAGADVRDPYKD